MTFLLDENFPAAARSCLAARGHTVLDVRGSSMEGSSDNDLMDLAVRRSAVTLTTDRDFYHTVPLKRPQHPGIAVVALPQPNAAAILAALERILPELEDRDPTGRAYLVTDNAVYMRSGETRG